MLFAFPTAKLSILETSSSVVSRVEAYVTAAQLMDAEDTQKQSKIRELQAVVAKGLKGINECRFQTDCEFAHECPGTC
jgi:hypothetical protein